MRNLILALMLFGACAIVVGGMSALASDPQPPVNPLTQCHAYVELVVKDRANAQTEASYFATRAHELEEQNKALAEKVKELEGKAEKK